MGGGSVWLGASPQNHVHHLVNYVSQLYYLAPYRLSLLCHLFCCTLRQVLYYDKYTNLHLATHYSLKTCHISLCPFFHVPNVQQKGEHAHYLKSEICPPTSSLLHIDSNCFIMQYLSYQTVKGPFSLSKPVSQTSKWISVRTNMLITMQI